VTIVSGGGVQDKTQGRTVGAIGDISIAESASACIFGSCENTFLLSRMEVLIASRRFGGSSVSVARLHKITPVMLPPLSASASLRRLTGTIATSGASGSAFWSMR